MIDVNSKQLALLKARLTAARMSAIEAHKSVSGGDANSARDMLPFLDNCARELEETARVMRAAADAAATSNVILERPDALRFSGSPEKI